MARTGVAALIGNTPLVEIAKLNPRADRVAVYAKLEGRNPGGSVKDRPALAIVEEAEKRGDLPARTLLDATSGNTGIAYAMLGAARGFAVELCMPANASEERKRILRAYGAKLVLTDPTEGQDGAIDEARARAASDPDLYFYADQYANEANPRAHYASTGPEIWRDTGGRVTHFVAGLGTSGTAMGVGRFLKERDPSIRVLGMQPAGPFHGIEGLKHMETTAHVPPIYRPSALDGLVPVATERAYALTRALAREEGLFCGPSSGAALAAALEVAAELTKGVIVTVLPDGGDRYLSTPVWDGA
ncbi:MAG TPA: cysteine synthase [Candidatus Thermoplasmatota archaeon]|nr:cysteine synthase [Candidatus Thermoplasmatota archaeon]